MTEERVKMNGKDETGKIELPENFVWENPELIEFKPMMRYHGASGCAVPPSTGDGCTDQVQVDE